MHHSYLRMQIVVVIAVVQPAYHQKIQMMHVKFVKSDVVVEDEARMHKVTGSIASNQVLTGYLEQVLCLMAD